MSATASVIALTAALAGQFPDALDHLRAGDVVPQVGLLLDRSCSMADGALATNCSWFAGSYTSGNTFLDKRRQMQSVLVGCTSATDGILDRWAGRVNLSIYEFGSGTTLRSAFGSSLASLESGVMAIPATGSTYMTQGLKDHGQYFRNYFNTSNSLQCRPNFIVMLSDGNPNGGGSTFNYECTAPVESRVVSANQPWNGADYLNSHPDILCSVPGNQNIKTYTIGFGAPGSFSPTNLQNIAASGGGEYFAAADIQQLTGAFESIISTIVSKSAIFFAPIAIQSQSMFADNYAYAASFKPTASGPWRGTVKKHCVTPPVLANGRYSTAVRTCLFTSPDGVELETNPAVADLWTGSQLLAADSGGVAAVLLSRIGGSPGAAPVTPYWTRRNILSWRPGTSGYVSVRRDTWTADDAWANGCERDRLLNLLHGYSYDANCTSGNPINIGGWPMGDPVHFQPTLLRYGACQNAAGVPNVGACYLVTGSNDGYLRIVDAATGDETTALIPGELWQPGPVSKSLLREIMDQPNSTHTHRYYVDGTARLFHEDDNADGIIQSTEVAYLVFGLGRGGRAYYRIPVSSLVGGVLQTATNPIQPIVPQAGTAFAGMQETWAAPWMGITEVNAVRKRVAVFGTGHAVGFDGPRDGAASAPSTNPVPLADLSAGITAACTGAGGFAQRNSQADAWCSARWFEGCQGNNNNRCYDGAGVPLDVSSGPLTYDDNVQDASAVRIYFSKFDLHSSDSLRIEDSQGNLLSSYTSAQLEQGWTPWVHGSAIVVRFVTNGSDTRNRGYTIGSVQWVPGRAKIDVPPVLGVDRLPSLLMVDLDRWNGASPQGFARTINDQGLLLQVTKACGGSGVPCIDQVTSPDLANFVCPVSAEVSVYTEAGVGRSIYFGDECAQIWKVWTVDRGVTWRAKRIINLNRGLVGISKDYRQIYTRLDLVLSACPGRPVVGVYFGTGDIQHPAQQNQLEAPAATNGRDLVGVVWDRSDLPVNLTEQNLTDVTSDANADARQILLGGKSGWYISLADNERMLRDTLVFDRTAYFKTYEPTGTAVECGAGSGVDRVYAVDSCDGSPVRDVDGNGSTTVADRRAWSGQTEIGGSLFFFTPKDGPVLVSHADISQQQSARLNARQRTRPGLYLWRERLDP